MTDSTTLSARGTKYLESPPYLHVYGKYLSDETIFHPTTNPQGCMSLAGAENTLISDLLADKLNQVRRDLPVTPEVFGYGRLVGHKRLCRALADYFAAFIVGSPLDPLNFVVVNGAGSALEALVASLCDPGDYVMVPTPMYHNLVVDVEKRFHARVLPAPLKLASGASGGGGGGGERAAPTYELDFQRMTADYERLERAGQGRIRALIHVNPHNPTGLVFPREATKALVAWCVERNVHLISDEIYALSRLLVPNAPPFVSSLTICRDAEAVQPPAKREPWTTRSRDFVHLVYSFSKDLGLNGYRAGLIYTENPTLLRSLDAIAYFTSIPSATQITLAALLEDHAFLRRLFEVGAQRTTALYLKYTGVLNSRGIRTYSSTAAMFIWVDLLTTYDRNHRGNQEYAKVKQ